MKKNIAIFFGGKSPEHEVSIITGIQVVNNIDKEKYNPLPIYVAKDGKWYYSEKFSNPDTFKSMSVIPLISTEVTLHPQPGNKKIVGVKKSLFKKHFELQVDCVFPAFHGGTGENGAFQGLFEICEIPYVGSEIMGSVLGIDKVIGKDVYKAHGIPSAGYAVFHRNEVKTNISGVISSLESTFPYPMFVKPAVGGSSIGVTKAKDKKGLENALEVAAIFDSKVIVEEGIENAREINVSVMGNYGTDLQVSVCEEVFHSGEFLTYDDKYKGSGGKSQGMASTKRKIPAELSKEAEALLQETAKKVFSALNCFGLIRVDFLLRENPLEAFVIEINTIPGSMAFYLWEASGMSFADMISRLVELAESRFEEKSQKTNVFESNILEDFKPGIKTPKLG